MKRFTNILVGIDLSDGDSYVCDQLSPDTEMIVQRALWLAKHNSARLRFFYSIEVSAQAQRLIEESQGEEPTVVEDAEEALNNLVERAKREGVSADCQVVIGKSWIELIYQVLRNEHDLVIVGTRRLGRAESFLLGSTGIKLLRKCPCPVWVMQPQTDLKIASLLVAHDLSPVGDLAMQLGCSMAQLNGAQLHVLYADENQKLASLDPSLAPEEIAKENRLQAEQHISSQLANFNLKPKVQVHIVEESPDTAILDYCKQHTIELLVMGTIARTGIPGLVTGNTAERLLPQIPCSVLAVKPEGFKSPIVLDEK